MSILWMGRYRAVTEALVHHGNCCIRYANYKIEVENGKMLTAQEWQVMEYIIEHEQDDHNMARLSERLCIPQSSFSKISNKLVKYGLVEKYQIIGNKKSIILKASDKGEAFYSRYSEEIRINVFQAFFQELEDFTDEQLNKMAKAIEVLDASMPGQEDQQQLVKIE